MTDRETPAMTTPNDADREAAQQLHRSLTLAPRYSMGYALDEDRIVDALAAARAEGEQEAARLREALRDIRDHGSDCDQGGHECGREMAGAALAAQPASKEREG